MNQLIYQKTQEISFALIRVASNIRRFTLRKKLEELGYHLLENITYRNYELTLHTIDTIQGFLDLGKNVYEIEPINHEILTREILILAQEIQEFSGEFPLGNTIENFFTKVESLRPNAQNEEKRKSGYGNKENKEIELPQFSSQRTKERRNRVQRAQNSDRTNIKERKEKIVKIIQETPEKKAQLKFITGQFPGLSERTLRYDLKALIETGELERIGSGPASFYAKKQHFSDNHPLIV